MQGDSTKDIQPNIREMVLDWLAAGVDPNKSIIFAQSHVQEVMILHSLLGMVTPMGWLMRVPTFKEKIRQMHETEETVSYGLVGYPVLMTADIILYKADTVPVGEDQLPHIELAREIVRRFNNLYGNTFPEPQAKLTNDPVILGVDGKHKMSKSLQNHVELAYTEEETTAKIKTAFTDPNRLRRSDPGRPEVCNIYTLHKYFNSDKLAEVYKKCTSAEMGCVEDKELLSTGINRVLGPFRERRRELASKKEFLREVLGDGAARARVIAKATLAEVLDKMNISEGKL
jgi:tryptophanyl-tRNA synthetase